MNKSMYVQYVCYYNGKVKPFGRSMFKLFAKRQLHVFVFIIVC